MFSSPQIPPRFFPPPHPLNFMFLFSLLLKHKKTHIHTDKPTKQLKISKQKTNKTKN